MERSLVVRKSAQHRNDIDGLRAIAVLAVVLYHAGVSQLKGGFIGVDVFFVISGFLIGGHVYSDMKQGRFSILEFYRKRAKRILPALLVVLLFCSLVSTLLLSAHELRAYGEYVIATVLSGSNILALRTADYFAPDANQNPLLMTWSLGVEEQFYVAFPIAMILMRKLDRTRLLPSIFLVAIASFCICIYQTHSHPAGAFYLLPARAWELAAGVSLALYENDRQAPYRSRWLQQLMSIAGIAAILTGLFFFDDHTAFPGYAALMPVAGAVLLISSPYSWINRRLLSLAPVVFLGSISYSLYLWHWPLLSFVHIVSDRPITPLMGCSISAISFLCAVLSYYFVEQPYRASQMPARPLLMRYALVCGLCIVPGLIFYIFSGLPQRVPGLSKIESSTDLGQMQCMADTSPILSKACHDVADQHPAIALIGDSHANALYPALLDIAHKSGFKLYEMAKASCPPLLGMARRIDTIAHAQECISYNAQVFSILKEDPSVKVVIMAGYWAGPDIDNAGYTNATQLRDPYRVSQSHEDLEAGLGTTIAAWQASGKKVVLLQDVPTFMFDPMRRIISHSIPGRRYFAQRFFPSIASGSSASISETFAAQDEADAEIVKDVASARSIPVFDPRKNLCSGSSCMFNAGAAPLYLDKQHVTVAGSKLALSGFVLPSLLMRDGLPGRS